MWQKTKLMINFVLISQELIVILTYKLRFLQQKRFSFSSDLEEIVKLFQTQVL